MKMKKERQAIKELNDNGIGSKGKDKSASDKGDDDKSIESDSSS